MTLGEQITYVLDRLNISAGQDEAKVDLARAGLLTDYRRLVAEEALNVVADDLGLTADDPTVTLPEDLTRILTLRHGATKLLPVTWERFADLEAVQPDTGTGPAWYFMASSTTAHLSWTPSTTEPAGLRLFYVARPEDPEDDDASMALLPAEFHELPCEMTVEKMAAGEDALELVEDARGRVAVLRAALRHHAMTRGGAGGHRVVLGHYHR